MRQPRRCYSDRESGAALSGSRVAARQTREGEAHESACRGAGPFAAGRNAVRRHLGAGAEPPRAGGRHRRLSKRGEAVARGRRCARHGRRAAKSWIQDAPGRESGPQRHERSARRIRGRHREGRHRLCVLCRPRHRDCRPECAAAGRCSRSRPRLFRHSARCRLQHRDPDRTHHRARRAFGVFRVRCLPR